MDDLKREINLQEAVTDKLIKADGMISKHPKIVAIRDTYKDLFKNEKQQIQSPKQIMRQMRAIMQTDYKK